MIHTREGFEMADTAPSEGDAYKLLREQCREHGQCMTSTLICPFGSAPPSVACYHCDKVVVIEADE